MILDPEFLELTRGLDLQAFWEENDRCQEPTPPQVHCPMAFAIDEHWLFEFLPVDSTLRYYQDKAYRDGLHRQANRWTQEYLGRSFFDEDSWQYTPRRIENLFGSQYAYREGGTPWLTPATDNPKEFAHILDQAEKIDLHRWSFPEEFLAEWQARKAAGKPLLALGTGSRGPATVMTSILKPETVFLWMYDQPGLMHRFRDLLAVKMVEFNQELRKFSGNQQPGWWITDDNSALFNRRLYAEYCFPILHYVLEALAPGDARRYQHSDSAMGHLLDLQYQLGIRVVNYGPTVDAGLIRQKMPDAWIYGQMPPFLLRNGRPEEIRQRAINDFRKAGLFGRMTLATAGSLAAGIGLGRMRWFMQIAQQDCQYNKEDVINT